jgi:hypothetical protein
VLVPAARPAGRHTPPTASEYITRPWMEYVAVVLTEYDMRMPRPPASDVYTFRPSAVGEKPVTYDDACSSAP